MNIHHSEAVCTQCAYEVAWGNEIYGAYKRAGPDECPRCEADLEIVS